ncbi:MAG: hypothetical protein ACSHYF_10985 [Verrucomicrobiaceae bacterium]
MMRIQTEQAPVEYLPLFEPLLGIPGVSCYLHGSRADGVVTAFSDFDDLIVVDPDISGFSQTAFQSALAQVEASMYARDPLQHHGHFVVLKERLNDFDGSPIPIHLLGKICHLNGEETIELEIDEVATGDSLRFHLLQTLTGISYDLDALESGKISLYQLKCMVSAIALIPPLLLQVRGEVVDKKAAIEEVVASQIEGYEAILWSSEIRSTWGDLLNWRVSLLGRLLPRVGSTKLRKRLVSLISPLVGDENLQVPCPVSSARKLISSVKSEEALGYREYDKEAYKAGVLRLSATLRDEFEIAGIGQFGDIGFPGISDLDVIVISKSNEDISRVAKRAQEIVDGDRDLSYFMEPHGAIVTSVDGEKYLKRLHTLYGLSFDSRSDDVDRALVPDDKRQHVIEITWSIFVLRNLADVLLSPLSHCSRSKFLIAKNAAQSVENFGICDDETVSIEKIYKLRKSYIESPKEFRTGDLDDFLRRAFALIGEALHLYSLSNSIPATGSQLVCKDKVVWEACEDGLLKAEQTSRGVTRIFVSRRILGLVNLAAARSRETPSEWGDYHKDLRAGYRFHRNCQSGFPYVIPSGMIVDQSGGVVLELAKRLYRWARIELLPGRVLRKLSMECQLNSK